MYKKSLEKGAKVLKKAKSGDYELPFDCLDAASLVWVSYRVSLPEKTLAAYKEDDTFKLFINDIGLLNYMLKIRLTDILDDDLSLFKGAFVENYMASQLAVNGIDLYY